jgi:sRNA-binding regulator protein Hfq
MTHQFGSRKERKEQAMTRQSITEISYLRDLIADQSAVFCWLANGVRLQGYVKAADSEVIFIMPLDATGHGSLMMVFKQQISSLVPILSKDRDETPVEQLKGVLSRRVIDSTKFAST